MVIANNWIRVELEKRYYGLITGSDNCSFTILTFEKSRSELKTSKEFFRRAGAENCENLNWLSLKEHSTERFGKVLEKADLIILPYNASLTMVLTILLFAKRGTAGVLLPFGLLYDNAVTKKNFMHSLVNNMKELLFPLYIFHFFLLKPRLLKSYLIYSLQKYGGFSSKFLFDMNVIQEFWLIDRSQLIQLKKQIGDNFNVSFFRDVVGQKLQPKQNVNSKKVVFILQPLIEDRLIGSYKFVQYIEKINRVSSECNLEFEIKPHPRTNISDYPAHIASKFYQRHLNEYHPETIFIIFTSTMFVDLRNYNLRYIFFSELDEYMFSKYGLSTKDEIVAKNSRELKQAIFAGRRIKHISYPTLHELFMQKFNANEE